MANSNSETLLKYWDTDPKVERDVVRPRTTPTHSSSTERAFAFLALVLLIIGMAASLINITLACIFGASACLSMLCVPYLEGKRTFG